MTAMEMKGLRILVTGASGFIGEQLAKTLAVEEGAKVHALVHNPEKLADLQGLPVKITASDIRDIDALRKNCADTDVIFHCAAITAETGNWQSFYDVNVRGTRNILEIARENRVARFVHLSSVAVYGLNPPEIVNENTPCSMSGNPYADSKLLSENEVWNACREGLQTIVLRPTNVYGPKSHTWTVRPIEALQSGRMFLVNGGVGLCNHLYIDNLTDAIILAAKNERSTGQAYQVNDGHPVKWREFFSYYANMAGVDHIRSVPLWFANIIGAGSEIFARISGGPPGITREAIRFLNRRSRFPIDKARHELGFNPRITLEEGMQRTEKWLRDSGRLS
ncbi:MAG: NAD-dependent epimerase/dehydratase family protein [Syntrophorhabdaceae bacterium]